MHRSQYLDTVKGVAIILVVLGHSIQKHVINFDENLIFQYIYSFHMALFMFVSGQLTFGKNIDLVKKFKTLVIPFIVWYQISYLLLITIHNQHIPYLPFIAKWIISPDWGLWFLWALFLNACFLKLVILYANNEKKYADIVAILVSYLLIQNIPTNYFGIGYVKWYFIFYGAGYLSVRYLNKIKFNNGIKISAILLFLMFGYIWRRFGPPYGWDTIMYPLIKYNLPGKGQALQTYQVITSFLGIAAVYSIIPSWQWFRKIFAYIGSRSMDIYVIHQNIIMGIGTGSVRIITAVCTATGGSLIIARILKKSAMLAAALYGGR